MTVRIKAIIETIISKKAESNPMLAKIIKAKLILNGIDQKRLTAEANDDPLIIAKLEKLAKEL
jgi:hypothetical protein